MTDVYDYLTVLGKNWDAQPYTFALENFRAFCAALGKPYENLRCIHVAGTNGKGSVAWMLAQSFQSAGFKTGLYTSPHMTLFTERIRIDGRPLPASDWATAVERFRSAFEAHRPTFFESATAVAFTLFQEIKTDVAVLETGLGGRLDATNLVSPLVSVITNVGHDHQDILGTRLEQIAAEKAGIMKPGVPAVVGEKRPEIREVFTAFARDVGAPLHFCDVEARPVHIEPGAMRFNIVRDGKTLAESQTELWGLHQCDNIAVVWKAIEVLNALSPQDGLGKPVLPDFRAPGLRGRLEILERSPLVVVDGAHNPEGAEALFASLRAAGIENPFVVWGALADKDHAKTAAHFPKGARFFFTVPDSPRAAPLETWTPFAQNLRASFHPDFESAYVDAKNEARRESGAVVVAGSLYLAAQALKYAHGTYLPQNGGGKEH